MLKLKASLLGAGTWKLGNKGEYNVVILEKSFKSHTHYITYTCNKKFVDHPA